MRTTPPLALILLFACVAHAAQDDAAYEACMQRAGGVNAAMHECIAQDTQAQDKRLNAAYAALRKTLPPERGNALQGAQRDWIRFRDSNCALRLDPKGGTLASVAAGECKRRMTRERAAELESLLMPQAGADAEAARCHDSGQFRVVERAAGEDAGADFLVRARDAAASAQPACRFDPGPDDFVIHHRDAERFKALIDATLVLENRTSPDDGQLIVWDLRQRRRVFDTAFSKWVSGDAHRLVFWRATETSPTTTNCPQLGEWRTQSLGAAIETQTQLTLRDMSVQELAPKRCAARQ